MIINQYQTVPYMKSLSSCVNRLVSDGYTDDYKVTEEGLVSLKNNDKTYQPADVNVVNFFRFEGVSDPDDMAILYAIETTDGNRGTLIDAYGTYSDSNINNFILEVDKMRKKTEKRD